jgi:hypothetical protein
MELGEALVHTHILWGHSCILASRLHIYIKYLLYLLSLVALSSITKKDDIVRKMDHGQFD